MIVFSTGGVKVRATASLVKSWRAKLRDWGLEQMMDGIGLELVRARGQSFGMGT